MAIAQPYAVKHANNEVAEALGRGLVVGDHFSIGSDENGAPMQIYGLLVIWEGQRSPAQSFHEPQDLINQMDFDDYFSDSEDEDMDDAEEVENNTSEESQTTNEG